MAEDVVKVKLEKGGTISSCVAVYLLKIYCALISMYFLAHKRRITVYSADICKYVSEIIFT